MASQQSIYQAAKDTIGQNKTEETDRTRDAQDHAPGMGEAAKQKAGEAKDSIASTGQAAKDKAGEVTNNAGKMEPASDKL
ncbi:hypothetical protein R1sor_024312 [Riccia sorocarpa]|uniref:Uncharacterized protein n=1 Tax=Riccia sorocarpa TaxID=122646 RepID=A0ABD3GU97_9MARC